MRVKWAVDLDGEAHLLQLEHGDYTGRKTITQVRSSSPRTRRRKLSGLRRAMLRTERRAGARLGHRADRPRRGAHAAPRRPRAADVGRHLLEWGGAARPRDENFLREERGWLGRSVLCDGPST